MVQALLLVQSRGTSKCRAGAGSPSRPISYEFGTQVYNFLTKAFCVAENVHVVPRDLCTRLIPWTPLPVSPTPMSLGVSRQEVYQALLNLNIGFLPLNKHTNEWYSTMLPNGDFSFDIFGSSSRVEAVEMWFRLDAPVGQTARSMRALYAVTMPERQAEVEAWVERTLATLSPEGKARDQTEINGVYATLQLVPRLRQVFLSIDIAK